MVSEQNRLDRKKKGIDIAYASQKRMIALNQSYTSKMRMYSYMIMVFALSIVISVMLSFSRQIIPSGLVDFLIIIIVLAGILWSYSIYVSIQNRDKLYFDELASDSAALIDPRSITVTPNKDITQSIKS